MTGVYCVVYADIGVVIAEVVIRCSLPDDHIRRFAAALCCHPAAALRRGGRCPSSYHPTDAVKQ